MTSPATARALISVSDKRGIAEMARALVQRGVEIVSTGGTARALRGAGIDVTPVADVTGFPEILGGRVKTLHPIVHGGVLADLSRPEHREELETHQIIPFSYVIVNLYPFRETIADASAGRADAIENIDIGGPTMIRAAAKNHEHVTVVVSPDDYGAVIGSLDASPEESRRLRRELAARAFAHTAEYDNAIAGYFAGWVSDDEARGQLPARATDTLYKVGPLRYGENPQQRAALYRGPDQEPLNGANVLQGKALSYNNLLDAHAAVACVREFGDPTVVIVKHNNPCGVGRHDVNIVEAYERALAGDPVSAFGGIVAVSERVSEALAERMVEHFFEVVVAPGFDDAAQERLGSKKNLRLVELDPASAFPETELRRTIFGTLLQETDPRINDANEEWEVATDRAPTAEEATALRFLWRVCKHVRSNAIVVGGAGRTYGIGAGQMSRVDAVELSIKKATAELAGAALASDAFFPFRDGVDAAAAAGVKAVIQPGGSRRDGEVVEAANEHGIAMVFTGARHFRH